MLLMGKSKKSDASTKPAAPDERVRDGRNLNVWLPQELMDAFDALRAEKTRRTKTAEVTVMFEEYLRAQGFWPPADAKE